MPRTTAPRRSSSRPNRDVAVARLLLEVYGADANEATDKGASLLWIACYGGHIEVARLVLEHGGDVNKATKEGVSPLCIACHEGHFDIARLLLENGANVQQTDNYGTSQLYFACQQGHVDVARLLLENGAAVDQATNAGHTPLAVARQEGHVDIALLLEDYGADTNQPKLVLGQTGESDGSQKSGGGSLRWPTSWAAQHNRRKRCLFHERCADGKDAWVPAGLNRVLVLDNRVALLAGERCELVCARLIRRRRARR